MNAFDLPEGNITENNYDEMMNHLNFTSPGVIAGLNLKTCELENFLSQVSKPPEQNDINTFYEKFLPPLLLYIEYYSICSNKLQNYIGGKICCQ